MQLAPHLRLHLRIRASSERAVPAATRSRGRQAAAGEPAPGKREESEMTRYHNPAMKQLADQQVRYAPVDVRIEQMDKAERLV